MSLNSLTRNIGQEKVAIAKRKDCGRDRIINVNYVGCLLEPPEYCSQSSTCLRPQYLSFLRVGDMFSSQCEVLNIVGTHLFKEKFKQKIKTL